MQAPNSPSSTSSESLASSGGSNGSPPTAPDAAKRPLQRRSSLVISLQRGMSLINVNSHAYNNNDNRNHNNTNTPASTSKQEEGTEGTGSKPVAKEKKQNPDTNWFHFAFRVVFNMPLLLQCVPI